jgi:nucleotide-binding universal stress UspA family protein
MGYERVIVGSDSALRGVDRAAEVASASASEATLVVCAYNRVPARIEARAVASIGPVHEEARGENTARATWKDSVGGINTDHIPDVQQRAVAGEPAQVLLQAADQPETDLKTRAYCATPRQPPRRVVGRSRSGPS